MRSSIADHVFEVRNGRLLVVQRSRFRSKVIADVDVSEIVEVELGQTRKAGTKRHHRVIGRSTYRSFTGRCGLRLVFDDDTAQYLDLPGTPDEITEAIAPVIAEVRRRGGAVLL